MKLRAKLCQTVLLTSKHLENFKVFLDIELIGSIKDNLITNLLHEGDEGRNTSVNPQIQLQYVQADT